MRTRARGLPFFLLALGLSARAAASDEAFESGPAPLRPELRGALAPRAGEPFEILDRAEIAWRARDAAAYLGLWEFVTPAARAEEQQFLASHFAAEESAIQFQRLAPPSGDATALGTGAQVTSFIEPRGRVEEWVFRLEKRAAGWAFVGREPAGEIDGLVHLSMEPTGFRANGLSLRLPDFELEMLRGTLFTSPENLGPTVLVFVGEGVVRVRPTPTTEQEQLRKFCGKPAMVEKVSAAFIRIHPADLHRVLVPVRLEPDPDAPGRLAAARKLYEAQVGRSFVLDASVPRSPWWVLPGVGDAAVTFEASRLGTLTFTVTGSEFEDLSLFDRRRRLQICLYASAGGSTRYSEDEGRAADVLQHDLAVRFEPRRYAMAAQDTLRIRLLLPAATLHLRLDESLRVDSITSKEAGRHLFFRVRGQNSLLVSLGALSGRTGEVSLTVRYDGTLRPAPVEHEVLQVVPPVLDTEPDLPLEEVLVYTNRVSWYPTTGVDDYALVRAHFDVPVGFTVVTGGTRTSARVEGNRALVEYRQDQPGKYITAAVGRLIDLGVRTDSPVALRGFTASRTRGVAEEDLERAGAILRFYEEEFGPCPYPSLSIAVIEGETPGGHSPPGMILLSYRPLLVRSRLKDDPANFTELPDFFLAHELAHQWWGQGVAGQNYHERWLSEGMAQYAAALWMRRTRGEAAFRRVLGRMARWALRESDEGPISLGYRLGHVQGDPQIFRAVVYDKGAYVLHMLRHIVGDNAFRAALTGFQARHRYGKSGTDELREALEAAGGVDLSGFFEEWVFGTAIPTLRLTHRTEPDGPVFRTTVDVRTESLPAPVPLEISVSYRGGKEVRRVRLEPGGGSFEVETPGPPGKVEINTDRALLAVVKKG